MIDIPSITTSSNATLIYVDITCVHVIWTQDLHQSMTNLVGNEIWAIHSVQVEGYYLDSQITKFHQIWTLFAHPSLTTFWIKMKGSGLIGFDRLDKNEKYSTQINENCSIENTPLKIVYIFNFTYLFLFLLILTTE